jgi:hypothetical protein
MLFGVKNGPPTYKRILTKTFKKYLDNFMKIFMDDITMYSDMENHLQKFKLCFQKCREYGISLNFNKFAFMIFLGMILGLLFPKKGNYQITTKSKVNTSIVNMPPPKIRQQIQVFNGTAQFYICFIKKFATIMAPIIKLTRKTKTFL